MTEKLAGGGGGANSDFDSKNARFCCIILVVLRGVQFPPHKEGPGFEFSARYPKGGGGTFHRTIALREKKRRCPSDNISIPVKSHIKNRKILIKKNLFDLIL